MNKKRSIISNIVDVVIVTGMSFGVLLSSLWHDLIIPIFRKK